ncbi:hypothetical protein [Streptomyces sp. EMB26]
MRSRGRTPGGTAPDGTGPAGAPDPGDGERRGPSRHRSEQVRAAALTATATVVAAAITAGVAILTNTVRVDVGSPEPTPTVTVTETKQVGSPSEPAKEPTASAPVDDAGPAQDSVLRSGEGIHMVADTSLDLDSDAPNWDARTFTHRGADLYLDPNRFIGGLDAPRLIVTTGQERSPATCGAQTALVGTIKWDDLRSGITACVVTSERRWAWVEVRTYSPDPLQLSVDVVVWNAVASTSDET